MTVELLTEHHLEFLSLKMGYKGSSESTLVKNATLFGITCHGSFILTINGFYAVKRKRTFDLAQLVVITKIAKIMRPRNTALSSGYDINGHIVLVCLCIDNPTLSGS